MDDDRIGKLQAREKRGARERKGEGEKHKG
jgi:hypothetical protein